ncbi:hypothetical protein [Actinomadura kijaniata]|uniref:hypothetical protein n=1 Tax=Actinomadura kijaniata TaxID=46161 RepID=UPI00082F4316|nr:hypothetical protein [Actinomadura kijaniata]
MSETDAELARRWLAGNGVVRTRPGEWNDNGVLRDAGAMAHAWAEETATVTAPGGGWDPAFALRLTFGLLDLLDHYWVTHELSHLVLTEPSVAGAFWAGCRRRLEAPEEPEALTYSLWVDWFEDVRTVGTAFGETLGRDVEALRAPAPGLLHRARHVLDNSGPVPWELKRPVYGTAVDVPELRQALFRGLLHGYHDVYGKLEPSEALALLRRLRLPEGTEHLAALESVLAAGHRNHHTSPGAWPRAGRNLPREPHG